jgi:hypothetical protein
VIGASSRTSHAAIRGCGSGRLVDGELFENSRKESVGLNDSWIQHHQSRGKLTRTTASTEELENLLRAASLNATGSTELDVGDASLRDDPIPPLPNLDLFGMDSLMPQQDLSLGQTPSVDPGASGLQQPPANQLIGLGLFEQLPSFDLIDRL